jgi:hypothetical protein
MAERPWNAANGMDRYYQERPPLPTVARNTAELASTVQARRKPKHDADPEAPRSWYRGDAPAEAGRDPPRPVGGLRGSGSSARRMDPAPVAMNLPFAAR